MKTLQEYKKFADTNGFTFVGYCIEEKKPIYTTEVPSTISDETPIYIGMRNEVFSIYINEDLFTYSQPVEKKNHLFVEYDINIHGTKIVNCDHFRNIKKEAGWIDFPDSDIRFTGAVADTYTEEMIAQESFVNGYLEKLIEMQQFILKHKDDLL